MKKVILVSLIAMMLIIKGYAQSTIAVLDRQEELEQEQSVVATLEDVDSFWEWFYYYSAW